MNMQELKQLIELHEAYQKHAPVTESAVFGAYAYNISVCKTCGAILRVSDKDARLLDYDVVSGVSRTACSSAALFKEFLRIVKGLGIQQAWADLLLEPCTDYASARWGIIRQLSVPSEDMLAKHLDTNPAASVAAAMHIPELRQRAYNTVLKCADVNSMYQYCTRVLNHTDEKLLAAAEAVAAVTTCDVACGCGCIKSDMDQFSDWHCTHLVWEQQKGGKHKCKIKIKKLRSR